MSRTVAEDGMKVVEEQKELWEVVVEKDSVVDHASTIVGRDVVQEVVGVPVEEVLETAAKEEGPEQVGPMSAEARCVVNRRSGRCHRLPASWRQDQPVALWRAACGWSLAGADVQFAPAPGTRMRCGRPGCYGGEVAPPDDGASSGE